MREKIFVQKWQGPWVVRDDFNMVMHKGERYRDKFLAKWAEKFKDVVERLGLLNLPLVGRRWTWSNMRVDPVCSWIDRFLVSKDCLDIANDLSQRRLNRATSDHFPICFGSRGYSVWSMPI